MGGGGGGRIAVWIGLSESEKIRVRAGNTARVSVTNEHRYFSGTWTVTNGSGNAVAPLAEPGTAWFYIAEPPTGIMIEVF